MRRYYQEIAAFGAVAPGPRQSIHAVRRQAGIWLAIATFEFVVMTTPARTAGNVSAVLHPGNCGGLRSSRRAWGRLQQRISERSSPMRAASPPKATPRTTSSTAMSVRPFWSIKSRTSAESLGYSSRPLHSRSKTALSALASKRTTGDESIGAATQLGGKFGNGRSGGMRNGVTGPVLVGLALARQR